MSTALHTLTTTAHTESGLLPICHCGWIPSHSLGTDEEVAALLAEHNAGFERDGCPRCSAELLSVRTRWIVREGANHYEDKRCTACDWKASAFPK